MRYMVAVIAVLLMAISAFGVVAPERLVASSPAGRRAHASTWRWQLGS